MRRFIEFYVWCFELDAPFYAGMAMLGLTTIVGAGWLITSLSLIFAGLILPGAMLLFAPMVIGIRYAAIRFKSPTTPDRR